MFQFDFCAEVKFCHQALSDALVGGCCSAVMDLEAEEDAEGGRIETSSVGRRWSECGACSCSCASGDGDVFDFVGVRLGGCETE